MPGDSAIGASPQQSQQEYLPTDIGREIDARISDVLGDIAEQKLSLEKLTEERDAMFDDFQRITLESNIRKMIHDMKMAIIRNFRG